MNAAGRLPLLLSELHREPGENVNSSKSGLSLWKTQAAALAVLPARLTTGLDEASNAMPDPDAPDLFASAGIVLDAEPAPAKPRRVRKPRPPTPAERAAAVRHEGGRRSKGPGGLGQRMRVGEARNLNPAPVVAFPLAKNVKAVADVIARLPHGYAPDLNRRRDQEVRRLQKDLVERGVPNKAAWLCARELVHVAYIQCVRDAHKEAGIL